MSKVQVGMTREEVKQILGEPDDFGGVSRKYRTPRVYKYGDIQYFFGPQVSDGLVYANRYLPDGSEIVEKVI